MRTVSEEIYGIPRSMIIGSSVTFTYAEDAQGVAQVMRTKEIEQPIADGPGKPQHIHRAIGRRLTGRRLCAHERRLPVVPDM